MIYVLRLLIWLRNLLNDLIRRGKRTMPASEFTQSVMIACPPAMLPDLRQWFGAHTPRVMEGEGFVLHKRLGREGTSYGSPIFLQGALTFKESEIEELKPAARPGGELHTLGIYFRRNLFGQYEVAAPDTEEGKTQVTVIGEGEAIPEGVDWLVTRLSEERFYQELGVYAGGDESPLTQLLPPEDVI